MIKARWDALKTRCRMCSRVTLTFSVAIGAVLIAGLLMAGGAAGLARTNTESFCISCHEMRDNVYAEFKDTIHSANRSGVRATCSDCHVPREPGAMLLRKARAAFELYGHFRGVIDTREKFLEHRTELARRVWTHMKKTDSRECRNCHRETGMSAELQSERAQARHAKGRASGLTCIDCHYGIAHQEPDGPGPQELDLGGGASPAKP